MIRMYNLTLDDELKNDLTKLVTKYMAKFDTDQDNYVSREEMKKVLMEKGKVILRQLKYAQKMK